MIVSNSYFSLNFSFKTNTRLFRLTRLMLIIILLDHTDRGVSSTPSVVLNGRYPLPGWVLLLLLGDTLAGGTPTGGTHPWWGVPQSTPHLDLAGVPPVLTWPGYPIQTRPGYTPFILDGGTLPPPHLDLAGVPPHPRLDGGTSPSGPGWVTAPSPRLDGSTPHPGTGVPPRCGQTNKLKI